MDETSTGAQSASSGEGAGMGRGTRGARAQRSGVGGGDSEPSVVGHEVEMGTIKQVRVDGVGMGRGGGGQAGCERSAASMVSEWMRDRVGRAHGFGGWKNVGGGGMGVTTAFRNSGRPVRSSKWRVRPTTADSHIKTPLHR